MTNRLSEEPQDTKALVALQDFLKDTTNKTVFRLQAEVSEAAVHLGFIMDYLFMPGKALVFFEVEDSMQEVN